MTTGILFVLHGRRTRIPKANLALLSSLQDQYLNPQAICFLEGDAQTLEQAVLKMAPAVDQLLVVPVLLFAATHVLWDIPKRIERVLSPHFPVTVLEPLGTTEAVYQFVLQQIQTVLKPDHSQEILLIAHGTGHFQAPYQQLQAIGERLTDTLKTPVYCAEAHGLPTVAEVAPKLTRKPVVMRLFLTDGHNVAKVTSTVQLSQPDSVFLPTLENQPALRSAVMERLNDLEYVISK